MKFNYMYINVLKYYPMTMYNLSTYLGITIYLEPTNRPTNISGKIN